MRAKKKGEPLLSFLQKELDLSGKAIKRALEQGACRVNGKIERFASIRLNKGDVIAFDSNKIPSSSKTFSLPILLEDNAFLICNKPTGLVSDAKAFSALLKQKVFLVHRLDKETSGVIVVAKTQMMQKTLEVLFRKREVTKTYFAIVKGRVRKPEGLIENHLVKKKTYQGQSVWGSQEKGLLAVTKWKCLKKEKDTSLLQCQPQTGRTHQLRVHLSEMGHPILGDLLYGRHVMFPARVNRLFLHAYRISFIHPKTKKRAQATAPIPQAFKEYSQ